MKPEKVTMYRASNGVTFNTEGEAVAEDTRLLLCGIMQEHTHQGETFIKDAAEEIIKRFVLIVK